MKLRVKRAKHPRFSPGKAADMGVSKIGVSPKWMVYKGKPYWNGWFGGVLPPLFLVQHPYGNRKEKKRMFWFHKGGEAGWPNIRWLFLVPLKGGRDYIIPQLAVYTTYIPLIYCLLGGYIIPTTLYRNLKNPLKYGFERLWNQLRVNSQVHSVEVCRCLHINWAVRIVMSKWDIDDHFLNDEQMSNKVGVEHQPVHH